MPKTLNLLAFDLGAESGRALLGRFSGSRLSLEEIHRFPTGPVHLPDGLHWDVLDFFQELKHGLALAAQRSAGDLASAGVDTWGVDYGLIGRQGELLGLPFHYRDRQTEGMIELACARVPKEEIFAITGGQFQRFNTLYQLLAMKQRGSASLRSAETLLFTPNLLDYLFTGQKLTEFTISSTSQMLDIEKRSWSGRLLKALDLPEAILTDIVPAGTVVGPLRKPIAREVGLERTQWITPAAHDTGSAVAAVPAQRDDVAFISSGTWSLVGIQTPVPIVTPEVMRYNFANEGCVGNSFRLLRNVSGLWLIQQCRRSWEQDGKSMSYEQISQMAAEAAPLVSLVDPDAECFLNPADMPEAIRQQCKLVGEPVPSEPAAVIRCALDSLALKYRWIIEHLEQISGRRLSAIHAVGGGIKNHLLCQLTADATGRPVIAGPVEASAIGNLLVQAMALGELSSPAEIRQVVKNSFPTVTYEPRETPMWDEAYGRFLKIVERGR